MKDSAPEKVASSAPPRSGPANALSIGTSLSVMSADAFRVAETDISGLWLIVWKMTQ